jgi:hypothetical protein
LPAGDAVTSHYALKWLQPLAAAGGSGSAWSIAAPPTVRTGTWHVHDALLQLLSRDVRFVALTFTLTDACCS